jgi:nicotinate phosphoribosyltransferase
METSRPPLSASIDFYKFTMGDMIYHKHPEAEVTFTFKNRNLAKGEKISRLVKPEMLRERLSEIQNRGFTTEEIDYLASLTAKDGGSRFTPEYLDFLSNVRLPDVSVDINPDTDELDISATGKWHEVSLWETVIMSEVTEVYTELRMKEQGLSKAEVWNEADRRLDEKISLLENHPNIKFAEFGTRRRSSYAWQAHVAERLANEVPENLIGTSNPWLAYKLGLKAIGTFAHELPMVYAGMADAAGNNPLDGHGKMLRDWEEFHRGDLLIALTDTFGSDFFFNTFTKEQAEKWSGYRQDSGNPIEFGRKAIEFLQQYDIDPMTKMDLSSDGLNVPKMIKIGDALEGKIQHSYGTGTNFTHDMHDKLPSTNIVVKATAVNGTPTVKLSDDAGKHTGPKEYVERYIKEVQLVKEAYALAS